MELQEVEKISIYKKIFFGNVFAGDVLTRILKKEFKCRFLN